MSSTISTYTQNPNISNSGPSVPPSSASTSSGGAAPLRNQSGITLSGKFLRPTISSPYEKQQSKIKDAMERLQDNNDFQQYCENAFPPLDSTNMRVTENGKLELRTDSNPPVWVPVQASETDAWKYDFRSIIAMAHASGWHGEYQALDTPLSSMLNYYGINPPNPTTAEEAEYAIKELQSRIDVASDAPEAVSVSFRSQTWLPSQDEYDAMLEDYRGMLSKLYEEKKAATPSSQFTSERSVEPTAHRLSQEATTASRLTAPNLNYNTTEERQSNFTIAEASTKESLRLEFQGLERALSSNSSGVGSTPGATTEISFEKDSPFGKAQANARKALSEVTFDAPDSETNGTEWKQDRLIATVTDDDHGKLESVWTKGGASITIIQWEGPIKENSPADTQIALRAAKQSGGRVTYYVSRDNETASLQSMLRFYGIEPSDPKTTFDLDLAKDALSSLKASVPIAEYPGQWGQLADINNIFSRIAANPKGEPRYISPSNWSPLGMDLAEGRKYLKQLTNSAEYRGTSKLPATITPNSVAAEVDETGTLRIHTDYINTNGELIRDSVSYPKPASNASEDRIVNSLWNSVLKAGGQIRLDNGIAVRQTLWYYGIPAGDLKTVLGRNAAMQALGEKQARIRMGMEDGVINIDAFLSVDDEEVIFSAVQRRAGNNKSLADYLSAETLNQVSEDELRKRPQYYLQKILSSPRATQFTRHLIQELGWGGPGPDEPISPEYQAKLLRKAIEIQLRKNFPSSNKTGALGYQFDQTSNWGKTYGEIRLDFESHLAKNKVAETSKSAILIAQVYRNNLPASFSPEGIPDDMRYRTSFAWVKFAQGINIAETTSPGAARTMPFTQLIDLPDEAAAEIDQQLAQAHNDEKKQNAQSAKDALDLLKLAPVLDWAVARGEIPAKSEGETFTTDDEIKAVSLYESHVKKLVNSYEALSKPLPSRRDMADAALRNIGISPDQKLFLSLEPEDDFSSSGLVKSLFPEHSARDLYMSGELTNRDKKIYTSIFNPWTRYPNDSISIQSLPDINKEFQAELDNRMKEIGDAYKYIVEQLLESLPPDERRAISNGNVKLFSVAGPGRDARKADIGQAGFILEVKFEDKKLAYRIFPRDGRINRLNSGEWLANNNEPDDMSYFTTLNWNEFSGATSPGAEKQTEVTLYKVSQSGHRVEDFPRTDIGRKFRIKSIADEASQRFFLSDENKADFQEKAKGYSPREAEIEKRSANWKATIDMFTGFIPFYGSIRNIKSDDAVTRIFNYAGLFLDIFSLGLPVSRLLSGSVRAGVIGARAGWRVGRQTLSYTVKKYLPQIGDALVPVPYLGGALTSGAIKFSRTATRAVGKGISQLTKVRNVKLIDGLPSIKDPAKWKPVRSGDVLRTVEDIDDVPVRNVGTENSPEFSLINPNNGMVYGPRYVEFKGHLYRKPMLSGYTTNISRAEVDQMTPRGKGIYDLNGGQYINIDGHWYQSYAQGNQRYIRHPTDRSRNFPVAEMPGDKWRVLPNGGYGGTLTVSNTTPVNLSSATLDERLKTLDNASGGRAEFIRNKENFEHSLDGNSVTSYANNIDGAYFTNEYTRSQWTFKYNARQVAPEYRNHFYANEIVRYQYELASVKGGFRGELPRSIKRENVYNQQTVDVTRNLSSNSPELLHEFMTNTPNGKMTQRILDDFGLKATNVSKTPNPEEPGNWDFVISVEPNPAIWARGGAAPPASLTPLPPAPPVARNLGSSLHSGVGQTPPGPMQVQALAHQRPLSDFIEYARANVPVNHLEMDRLTNTGTLNGRRYVSFGNPPQAYEVVIERNKYVRLHSDGEVAGEFLKYNKEKKVWEIDPNPPRLDPKPRLRTDTSPEVNFARDPNSPKFYRNFNAASFGKQWKVSDHVNVGEMRRVVNQEFNVDVSNINVHSISSRDLATKTGVPYDSNLRNNPPAWTSPTGEIYVAYDHPDYVLNGVIDQDKVRSTVMHEFIHAASFNHTGLQGSRIRPRFENYDENFVDFFAFEVYKKIYPGRPYKSGYFSGDGSIWLGELVRFMEASGTMTRAEIREALFRNPGSLKPLKESALSDWKRWSDFSS
ncbi:hypothetical protein [Burkholderia territorii]|uniref:hypothetical protein n=1 Tax=Burkholderia territorii TaxID=1503055 RepID=UPI000B01C6C6|nr:hypothetical protein [Burkholderia territorii]